MTSNSLSSVPSNQSGGVVLILLGLLIAAAGLGFSYVVGVLLFDQYQSLSSGNYPISTQQLLYEGLWLVFFVSLTILGLSLLMSGLKNKKHDVVPGPTLYFMGASLMAIALMMAMYGQVLHAVVAAVVGLVLMVLEWYYDVV